MELFKRKIILKTISLVLFTTILAFSLISNVNMIYALGENAQDNKNAPSGSLLCDVFPFLKNINGFNISQACSGNTGKVVGSTGNFISFALNLVFVGLIILAVFIIIRSAIKYIQSEGNEGKIVEAQKAIKAVFVGIGVLIVGIVGIFIVIAFFNASGATNADTSKSTDVQNFLNQASS